nr:uncharacterized protein LOC106685743 isoform X3 [Halyomorpha halys]
MDRNQWSRNVLEHQIEQWREERAQKMAARLQLNSSKPRTISSNVLGYMNYRQPMTVQPGFRQHHGEDPRFNHVDQRWNPNYNYSGYREQHHSPRKQYHHGGEHRSHGYSHGSYHQQQSRQKKGGHFSSHKSLYNERRSTNKPSNRFSSSCGSINNTTEVGNQDVSCSVEHISSIRSENVAPSTSLEININTIQAKSDSSENVIANLEGVGVNVEQEVEKTSDSDERIHENVPESDRLQDNIVIDADETIRISELNENHLLESQYHVGDCAPTEANENHLSESQYHVGDCAPTEANENHLSESQYHVGDCAPTEADENHLSESQYHVGDCAPTEANENHLSESQYHVGDSAPTGANENHLPESQYHVGDCAPTEANVISDISVLEPVTKSSDEVSTLFVDASSTISINIENSDDVTVVDTETVSEPIVEVNDHEMLRQSIEPQSTDVDQKELSEDTDLKLVSEQVVTALESSTVFYQCTDVISSEIVTNVEEVSAIEQMASSETSSDPMNETLDLELNLSFKQEIEIVEETNETVDPLELDAEVVGSITNEQSNNEGYTYAGTSYNENAAIFPVALLVAGNSDIASIIHYNDISSEGDNDLSKEIEIVENKLANISIVNKDNETSDGECFTPMKRERRHILLDATNILPSSTIKFAVREVRKNDETEIIVTPVRRSARLSTRTPVSAHKNVCVQKLEELSPEVKQKMKFVQNPAIDNPPEC